MKNLMKKILKTIIFFNNKKMMNRNWKKNRKLKNNIIKKCSKNNYKGIIKFNKHKTILKVNIKTENQILLLIYKFKRITRQNKINKYKIGTQMEIHITINPQIKKK